MVVSVSKELTVQEMNWEEEEKKHENGHCVLIDSCLNLATSWYFSALSLTVPSPNILLFVICVSIRLFTSNTLANQCITPNKENCGHINDINVNSVNDFFSFPIAECQAKWAFTAWVRILMLTYNDRAYSNIFRWLLTFFAPSSFIVALFRCVCLFFFMFGMLLCLRAVNSTFHCWPSVSFVLWLYLIGMCSLLFLWCTTRTSDYFIFVVSLFGRHSTMITNFNVLHVITCLLLIRRCRSHRRLGAKRQSQDQVFRERLSWQLRHTYLNHKCSPAGVRIVWAKKKLAIQNSTFFVISFFSIFFYFAMMIILVVIVMAMTIIMCHIKLKLNRI